MATPAVIESIIGRTWSGQSLLVKQHMYLDVWCLGIATTEDIPWDSMEFIEVLEVPIVIRSWWS